MPDPRQYQFDLFPDDRPEPVALAEEWYPGIRETWAGSTSRRIYDPIFGVRAVVIHATAGASSEGAVSVMRAGKASFHWLVPDEDEAQHGAFAWACAPEARAAWHVRNAVSHPDVWAGNKRTNHFSLGVEIVNRAVVADAFSDWQVDMAAQIVRYAWAKYPNLRHVVSHAKLDPERRTDPGAHFPWENFRTRVLTGGSDPIADLIATATAAGAITPNNADPCPECD
ncbi:MAG: N-acetylmuramoyl-L-alanine amidase [Parvularculaceae bacterium]